MVIFSTAGLRCPYRRGEAGLLVRQKNTLQVLVAVEKICDIGPMEIELLSLNNLKQLTKLVLELWDDGEQEEEFEYYKKIISSENEACFLGRVQESYISFVHVSIRNDYVEGATNLPVAYVEAIYVKPDHQRQGIAKRMIQAAEDWARQKGYKQLASDTSITNVASIDFHKKIGFHEVERIVCFIKAL